MASTHTRPTAAGTASHCGRHRLSPADDVNTIASISVSWANSRCATTASTRAGSDELTAAWHVPGDEVSAGPRLVLGARSRIGWHRLKVPSPPRSVSNGAALPVHAARRRRERRDRQGSARPSGARCRLPIVTGHAGRRGLHHDPEHLGPQHRRGQRHRQAAGCFIEPDRHVDGGLARGQPQAPGHRRRRRLQFDVQPAGRGTGLVARPASWGRVATGLAANCDFSARRTAQAGLRRGTNALRTDRWPSRRPGLPPDVHRQRTTHTGSPGESPSAPPMSSGTRRHDTCLDAQSICMPIGSIEAAARQALQPDQVVGRAGPVHLAVGQPAQQVPRRQLLDRGLHLGRAHAVAAGERAAPGQPPARLVVDQRRGHPVREDLGRRPAFARLARGALGRCVRGRPAVIVPPVACHSA